MDPHVLLKLIVTIDDQSVSCSHVEGACSMVLSADMQTILDTSTWLCG